MVEARVMERLEEVEVLRERVEVRIDITDWAEEVEEQRPALGDRETAIQTHMRDRHSAQRMGRMIVAAREMGLADPELLPPTKALLQTGAAAEWARELRSDKELVELENGHVMGVPMHLGPVDEEHPEWVGAHDEKAVEWCWAYLLKNGVPGHIKNRANVLVANGEDPDAIEERLVGMVREVMSQFR